MTADMDQRAGDPPTVVTLDSDNSRYDVTAHFRLKTNTAIPITTPLAGQCSLNIDSTHGNDPELTVTFHDNVVADAPDGPTVVSDVAVSGLESADYSISGSDLGCYATILPADIVPTVQHALVPWISKRAAICGAVAPFYFQACSTN